MFIVGKVNGKGVPGKFRKRLIVGPSCMSCMQLFLFQFDTSRFKSAPVYMTVSPSSDVTCCEEMLTSIAMLLSFDFLPNLRSQICTGVLKLSTAFK